jgi:hypothetical protein
MTQALKVFYATVLLTMIGVTLWAGLKGGNVLPATFALWSDPWGRATLVDTYFAFTTIFLWICYKEKSWAARGLWFVLIMALGNLAVASYMLMKLSRLKPKDGIKEFLTRTAA